MTTLVSRADLIYLFAREGEQALARGAGFLRYAKAETKPREILLRASIEVVSRTPDDVKMEAITAPVRTRARYWRVSGYDRVDEESRRTRRPDFDATPFSDEELSAPEGVAPPIKTPLMPWSRLDPFLRAALGRVRRGSAVDIKQLVRDVARVKPIQRLPRVKLSGWAPRAQLLVDRDTRLTPFWDDQSAVFERLRGHRGLPGLEVLVFFSAPEGGDDGHIQVFSPSENRFIEYRPPERGAPVLLLGECGYLRAESDTRNGWRALGERLFRRGCRPVALAPCPRDRWPLETNRGWLMAVWDRFERCPKIDDAAFRGFWGCPSSYKTDEEAESETASADRSSIYKERAGRLLRLLSVAVRIEPALLRDARRLFRSDQADVATEADAWRHESVQVPSPVGLGLDPQFAQEERERLARFVSGDRDITDYQGLCSPQRIGGDLRELLSRHHAYLPEVIRLEEHGYLNEVDPNEKDARIFKQGMKRMTATLAKAPTDGRSAWCFRFSDRLPRQMRAKYPELAYQWALACRHQDSLTSRALPEGWDPEQIAWAFKESERYWRIWQDGSSLVIASDEWRPGTEEAPRASPVGGITTCRSFLSAESREQSAPITLFSYKKIDLSQAKAVSLGQLEHLRGEWESLKLETIPKPSWASEIGRDSIGLYADFTYQGATQRLRWINPGSFIIGSPEDEPGRYDNERQHRVTLTRGYWLADTPCTQALWQAVMGENPSYFKTPERPVENVSWEDCQRFLERIDGLIPDLGLRLPTEAEWEYACRAATSTALYSGPIEIRGECDAPALDPIAWYSGNSGEEFELENGWDSSEWPNKQYEHTRAGTHPVKRKNPNDWGLYDMLGNVWEWCDDWYGEYPSKSARRVLRGGGWFDDARYARSACRLRLGPGYRYNFIGFRFARGQ